MGRGPTLGALAALTALAVAVGFLLLRSSPAPAPTPSEDEHEDARTPRRPLPAHDETPFPMPREAPPSPPPSVPVPAPVAPPSAAVPSRASARPSAVPESPYSPAPPLETEQDGPRRAPAPTSPPPAAAPRRYDRPPPPEFQSEEQSPAAPVGDERLDTPMVWSLDEEGIRGAFQEGAVAIGECYAAWLEAEPEIAGRVMVEFTVVASDDPDAEYGVIQELELTDSQLDHTPLSYCILNVFQDFRFANPDGEPVKVHFPLVFSDERQR
jgi:hypothetical protein